jgi:integrase
MKKSFRNPTMARLMVSNGDSSAASVVVRVSETWLMPLNPFAPVVPLRSRLDSELYMLRASSETRLLAKASPASCSSSWVRLTLPAADGGYLAPPTTKSWLAGAVERCQRADKTFPRVTAHDLRHTAASLAIGSGANPKVVQRMLGHASAAMTLDVYADLFDSDFTAVADKLSETVGKLWARGGDEAIQQT